MKKNVECSIALVKNDIGYLYSQRTKKPFCDYFEFPGGKIENGETPEEALIRECHEELDIIIKSNIYHGNITHSYKDILVRLHIFEITEYIGTIKSNEGQNLEYINHNESNGHFLESTDRVLNRLRLRELFFITPYKINNILEKFINLDKKKSFVRLRSSEYSELEYINDAKKISNICYQSKIPFIIDKKFFNKLGIIKYNGIHFTSKDLNQIASNDMLKREKGLIYSASCHNLNDIHTANNYNFDFIILSPINYSKYLTKSLGWDNFKLLAQAANMPVYALGGIQISDLELCKSFNGFGVSGISKFWY